MRWRTVPLVAAITLLAGCGGTKTVTITRPLLAPPTARTQAVSGHPCSSKNYYLNCLYRAAGQTLTFLPGAPFGFSPQYGLDFAWGGPPASLAVRGSVRFAVSYLSGTSKDWRYSQLHDYLSHGIAVGFVYETYAGRALAGCSAGRTDAQRATYLLSRYGIGQSAAIYFAVDTDTTAASVASYFACAHAVLGRRTGVYGGFYVVSGLLARGTIGYCWQTIAWSYGNWNFRCGLEQTGIDRSFYGYGVDPDRRIAVDAGLYPPFRPPPPPPTAKWRAARNASLRAYHARGCTKPVLGPKACSVLAGRVVHYQQLLDGAYGTHPRCWGPRAQKNFPVCQIVRPEVAIWNSAARASDRALRQHGCRRPYRRTVCRGLAQRSAYFHRRSASTFHEFT